MYYQYVAYTESGELVKGKLSAVNEETAVEMLGYAGYQTVNLKSYSPFFSSSLLTGPIKVKNAEIILFYRQLALLLESGVNIIASLELLRTQSSSRTLKRILEEVIASLRSGHPLSEALSEHPEVFSKMTCRTLSIGEQTGSLEVMLRQIADYMERDVNASKGVKSALMYPVIASVVTVVVVAVLIGFVLPAFSNLYDSLGAEMPAMTRFLISLSDMLRNNILYIMIVLLVAGILAVSYTRTPEGRFKLDKLMLRLPMIGRINQLNILSGFCRSISLLFRAGLPLTEVMPLIIQGSSNKVMTQALIDVQQDMMTGEGLSQPMAKNDVFLPMMVQMVKVGEEIGNLDVTLLAVAQSYEAEAADRTKALIGLVQPVMTIIIAGIVGLVALSMVSAMYSIYGQAF